MLQDVTILLKNELNTYLATQAGEDPTESRQQRVVFPQQFRAFHTTDPSIYSRREASSPKKIEQA